MKPRALAALALLLALPALPCTAGTNAEIAMTETYDLENAALFTRYGRARVLGAREEARLCPARPAKRSFISLFTAVAKGDLRTAKRHAPKRTELDALDTKTGATPLTWAAQCGRADAVAWLLSLGANPEQPDGQKATPLATAARFGQTDAARLLLARGADPDRPTPLGLRPLLLACGKRGNLELVRLLVEHGANPHLADNNGWTPLAMAVKSGRTQTTAYLLALGASPDGAPEADYSPLHWAAAENRENDARLLLAAGANPALPGARGELAVEWCESAALRALLEDVASADEDPALASAAHIPAATE